MKKQRLAALALLIATPALLLPTEANALKTASATVKCPTAKLQAAIDAAAPGVPTTIGVTGTCAERIDIPQGKTIILSGGGNAEIRASSTAPLITNRGSLKLLLMKVTNLSTTSGVVLSAGSSELEVIGSTIKGDNAEIALEIAGASTGRIFNSVVSSKVGEGIGVYSQSTAEIFGRPSVTAHPTNGYTSTISSADFSAISCGQGGNVVLRAEGTGKVNIRSTAGSGIALELCNLVVRNKAASAAAIDVLGNDAGISSVLSKLLMMKLTVQSSNAYAMSIAQSDIRMGGVVFKKSGEGDIAADGDSVIKFDYWTGGKTSLMYAFDGGYQSLVCADRVSMIVDNDDVTLPAGKTVADLRSTYPSCFPYSQP